MFKDKKAREAIEQLRSYLDFKWPGLDELNDFPLFEKEEKTLIKSQIQLNEKLNLILKHLNLQYVAQTEKKEPAKLVEKKEYEDLEWNQFACIKSIQDYADNMYESSKPKKRKYTKSGKYSKKNK